MQPTHHGRAKPRVGSPQLSHYSWHARPLSALQFNYAAFDAECVLRLADVLEPLALALAPDQGAASQLVDAELAAFHLIREMLSNTVAPVRVTCTDLKTRTNILLDGKTKSTITRLYLEKRPWRIGLIDDDGKESRHELATVDDIRAFANQIRSAAERWL